MYAVGTRTIFILVLLILVPILLLALAIFGVLLLWRYLRKRDAQRASEQAARGEAPDIEASPMTEESAAPVSQPLSDTLREHRLRCGLTQEAVAEALDVSRQAVSKWETGTAEPTAANMLALARLYGVSAEELLRAAAGE